MTFAAPPAQTVLAAQAAHPCRCVRRHQPPVAEYERHHIHPAAVQLAQGLTLAKLTPVNEWESDVDKIGDEVMSYWVLLDPNAHSAVHVLLRRYAHLGGAGRGDDHGFNRYVLKVAAEGNRRVMAHGGWKETA